jgi:hypothetical protein
MMETACASETSLTTYKAKRYNNAEDYNMNISRRKNIKTCLYKLGKIMPVQVPQISFQCNSVISSTIPSERVCL